MRKIIIAILAVLAAGRAGANDSVAELRTGGLAYVQTEDISMESEHLTISPQKVDVEYVFLNRSDHDVEALVAFPMPDITGGIDMMLALPREAADNFLDFTVSQDGRKIEPNLQQRVYANGIDLTDVVAAKGIPLMPFGDETAKALEKLPPEVIEEWKGLGLVVVDEYDAGKGLERHPVAVWTLKSAYWWKTVYPANAKVEVEHRYLTSLGETVTTTYLEEGKPQGPIYDDYVKRYCIDDAFVKIAQKNYQSEQKGRTLYVEAWISYILTTGSNWSGPIRSFTLTLDKGAPENFISFCGEGVKKTGPTTFEMKKEDFYPEKELEILLLKAVNQ